MGKVVITSLVESTVEVNDFAGEKFFGCEFVRAVTGFHCRLCSINIREAHGVIPHVDSRQHQNNYAAYVKKNPEYEKTQKEQNKDLFDVMSQHEEKSVVLAESSHVKTSFFLSVLDTGLVRIPSVMNPEKEKEKEKENEKEKEKEEKEKEKEKENEKVNPKEKKTEAAAVDDEENESDKTESESEKEEVLDEEEASAQEVVEQE